MIGPDRSFGCFGLLPAPRRMTWGGLCGNESRHCRTAASIIRSNQSVRTASMTPAVPRGPPSRLSGIIIFSQRRRREASPANIPAKWSWITCAHNARPAAVCRAVRSRASSSPCTSDRLRPHACSCSHSPPPPMEMVSSSMDRIKDSSTVQV